MELDGKCFTAEHIKVIGSVYSNSKLLKRYHELTSSVPQSNFWFVLCVAHFSSMHADVQMSLFEVTQGMEQRQTSCQRGCKRASGSRRQDQAVAPFT